MKLCVFQGTFNPIHNAHLRVGEWVLNTYHPDKLIFIPAANPPHKNCNPNYAKYRYNMVKLALEDKMATAEEIAVMSEIEVCELISKEYELVYSESEEIGLVHKDKLIEYGSLVKVISR